jgi:hypothetical protein
MHSITLAASLFFTIALALPKAKLEVIQVREIVKARQDDSSSLELGVPTGCIMPDSIMSIELSVPTAPPAALSALVSFTDACNLPTLTGSVSSQYSSYQQAISSWYSQYGDVIMNWSESYQTACPIYASIMQSVSMGSAVNTAEFLSLATASCSDDSTASDAGVVATSSGEDAKTTSTADSESTGSGTGSAPTGSAAQSDSGGAASATTNAAPHQTLYAAAAGLVVGLAGVVAVL